MKIVKLILRNYRRFPLTSPEIFTYIPENKVQIIIGTNGSGKSSLLSQLTVQVPDKKDFRFGGGNELHVEHNNNSFILSSVFGNKTKHSFLRNGENLNPSGTGPIQKNLIEQHFFIGKDVYNLLLGTDNLTDMSVGDRRKWFTTILNSDHSYAIETYDKLKKRRRDIVGAISLGNERILKEEKTKIDYNEIKTLEPDNNELRSLITTLNNLKDKVSSVPGANIDTINNSINTLSISLDRIYKLAVKFPSKKKMESTLNSLKYKLKSNSDLKTNINKKISDLEFKKDSMNREMTGEDITSQVDRLHARRKEALSKLTILTSAVSAKTITEYSLIHDELLGYFITIESLSHHKYSKDRLDKVYSDIKYTEKLIYQESKVCNALENKVTLHEKIKQDGTVTCPECSNKWIPGYDERSHANDSKALNNKLESISNLSNKLKSLQDEYSDLSQLHELYVKITSIFNKTPELNNIYKIAYKAIDFKNSKGLASKTLNLLYKDINEWSIINEIDDIILAYGRKETESKHSIKLAIIESELNALEKNWTTLTEQINKCDARIHYIQNGLDIVTGYEKIFNEISELKSLRDNEFQNTLKIMSNDSINDLINTANIMLVANERIISNINAHDAVIKSIVADNERLHGTLKTIDLILNELDPKTGLIGEIVLPGLNSIIRSINIKIKNIWTYPMEIMEYVPENDDISLDYRLRLKVNDGEIVPECKLASSGMKEIINLAFRLVVMSTMDLDMPLFLDEFGKSLDPLHRANVYRAIAQNAEDSPFSQVFMVSHFNDAYGSITDADFVILSDTNIEASDNITRSNQVTYIENN